MAKDGSNIVHINLLANKSEVSLFLRSFYLDFPRGYEFQGVHISYIVIHLTVPDYVQRFLALENMQRHLTSLLSLSDVRVHI